MQRFYTLLLFLLPTRFRRAHAQEMLATFRARMDHARAERGVGAASIEALAEYGDVIAAAVRLGRPFQRVARQSSDQPRMGVVPSLLDWRQAVRRLLARPALAGTIVLTLALGIAANAVVFSVADAVLFRGAPYPNGPRLHELYNRPSGTGTIAPGVLKLALDEWRRHEDVFARVEGFNYATFVMTDAAVPETLTGASVTPGLFGMLGARPALGRTFDPGEDEPGRDRVVIVSHTLWQRQFGGDPGIVGRRVQLDNQPYQVVGVMPKGFRFPAQPQELWVPESRTAPALRLQAVVLLPPDAAPERIQERIDTIAHGLQESQPMPAGWELSLMPLRGVSTADSTRRAVQILVGAVALVLLIACANVGNLFLTSALVRDREIAVRLALGASRGRIVRELFAEGALLAAAAAIVGLGIAWWGVDVAVSMAPDRITRLNASEIRLDGRTMAFTVAVSCLAAVLFALFPALRASGGGITQALAGRTALAGHRHGALRSGFVIAEVALSVVLLVGAALLIRSFDRLQAVDLGFDTSNVVQITLALPADRYSSTTELAFFRDLQTAVEKIPGVLDVTAGNGVPGNGSILFASIAVDGGTTETRRIIMPVTSVAPDYFAAFRVPIVAGRGFLPDDEADRVIVSESLAKQYWPDGDAVGSRVRFSDREPWRTVVGVAREVRLDHLMTRVSGFEVYTPLWPRRRESSPPRAARPGARLGPVTLFVRSERRATEMIPRLRQAVWRLDDRQPVDNVMLVEDGIARTLAEQRFGRTLMAVFSALALVVAVAGLYAVLAQLVVQRRHEIGVRMALGAGGRDVLRLIVGRGLALTLAGVVIGLAGAWTLSRYLQSQLYETSATEPVSFLIVAATMTTVALLACWIPTRRALRIDPADALRLE